MENQESEISRHEFDAALHRFERENDLQNKRIDVIEKMCQNISELAATMKLMLAEQKEMSRRIGALENVDKHKWQLVVEYIIAGVVGGGLTFLLGHFG